MAATITVQADGFANPEGGAVEGFVVCSGKLVPGTVSAGGEAVTFADFTDTADGSAILTLVFSAVSEAGTATATYLPSTGKVKYYDADGATGELTGDQSAQVFYWVATLAV